VDRRSENAQICQSPPRALKKERKKKKKWFLSKISGPNPVSFLGVGRFGGPRTVAPFPLPKKNPTTSGWIRQCPPIAGKPELQSRHRIWPVRDTKVTTRDPSHGFVGCVGVRGPACSEGRYHLVFAVHVRQQAGPSKAFVTYKLGGSHLVI